MAQNGNLLIFVNPHSEHAGHAGSIIRTRQDLKDFNAIVICSGDGLVFEILNGILQRPDRKELLKIPFGIIPTGTGNGLLASIFSYKKYRKRKVAIHGQFKTILRLRSPTHKTYRGRLSYLRSDPADAKQPEPFKVYKSNDVKSPRDNRSNTTSPSDEGLPQFMESHHGKEYGRIPSLNDDVPENWEVVEDEFCLVYAMSLSHISNNGHYVPQANLVDDQIYLTYILKDDIDSRWNVTKFLLAIEGYFGSSGHQQFDFFRMVAVKAFRLEPIDSGSVITVDGEVIDTPKIQATATKMNISVMSK